MQQNDFCVYNWACQQEAGGSEAQIEQTTKTARFEGLALLQLCQCLSRLLKQNRQLHLRNEQLNDMSHAHIKQAILDDLEGYLHWNLVSNIREYSAK